jgi:UDP-glucose:(heptosyl)LPS alpha-1,3-glucosyltransferase
VVLALPRIHLRGGIEKVFSEFLKFLSNNGYSVTLVSQEVDPQLISLSSKIIYLKKAFSLPKALFWKSWMSRFIRNEGLGEAVIFATPCEGPWKMDFAFAGSCHLASLFASAKHGARKWLLNPSHYLICFMEWFTYNFGSKFVLVPSRRTALELQQFYGVKPSKIVVLPHGVDAQNFYPCPPNVKRQLRDQESIAQSSFVMLTATNEVDRKGCFLVLDAMKLLMDQGKLVHYIIVGRDNYFKIEKYAQSLGLTHLVRFLPPRSGEAFVSLFHLSDIFILPTFYESFGLVGIEALASGLPLLATKVGGIEDYLVDGKTGFFIHRTKEGIAKRIEWFLENPGQMSSMAILCREQAEKYSWDQVLKPLELIIKDKRLRP